MEHVNGWCFRGIYKGGLWENDLHVSAPKPTDYLHVNRVVVSQTFHPKSVSPEVFDQEQFACIISVIFLIFLKHSPPRNFS